MCMHMQGTPQTMQLNPAYTDVVREVGEFFEERLRQLALAGVSAEQVVLDVGIGFGKTLEHNLELLAHLNRFTKCRRPLLVGLSRKSFIGLTLDAPIEDRLAGTLACVAAAMRHGVQVVRVHDVKAVVHCIRMLQAIDTGQPPQRTQKGSARSHGTRQARR